MIFDSIENLEKYKGFHSGLDKAFDFMKNNDLAALEQGMHEIEGRDIFVISALADGATTAPVINNITIGKNLFIS